jgi:hypothetical protein
MSALQISPPFPIFSDIDGQPLEAGFIWIGQVNLDPQTNPIQAFSDGALTIPIAQPIRTIGGYPAVSGTPARFYVDQDYSIRVMNKNGSVIYNSLNGNAFPNSAGNLFANATGDGTQTVFPVSFVPSLIYINGVYQNQSTYTISGSEVTFSEAPPLTSVIEFLI